MMINQIRDTRRDKAYFDRYIESLGDVFEKARKDKLKKTSKGYFIGNYIDSTRIIYAMYSRGDDLNEIRKLIYPLLDIYANDCYEDINYDVVSVYSFVTLFEIEEEYRKPLQESLDRLNRGFTLLNYFLGDHDVEKTVNSRYNKRFYKRMVEIILASPEERPALVKKWLRYWYKIWQGEYWHDHHKRTDKDLYFGYWAFEVAAVVKILDIDDELFKDSPYYPYDLVHAHFTK